MLEYVDGYKNYLKNDKNRADNTVESYVSDIKRFYEYLLEAGVCADDPKRINKTNILMYRFTLESAERPVSTIARKLAAIKSFFKYLYKTGIIQSDVSEDVSPPKVDRSFPGVLSVDEVEALLAIVSGGDKRSVRNKAMLELLYATGIKVTELVSIKTSDVYLNLKYIRCGKSERIVPINENAEKALRDYIEIRKNEFLDEEALFIKSNGEKMTRQGFWKIIKRYARQVGIDKNITPHTIRHSFAAHMIQNGADIYSVMEMLGQSAAASGRIYLKGRQSGMREVYLKAHPRK